jgi:hypothetical protein
VNVVQKGALTKQVTCTRCQSELEYEPEDVKSTTYTDGDTISDIKYHVQCPLCLQKLGQNFCFVYVDAPGLAKGAVSPFVAEPLKVGTFTDANQRQCEVTVTSPSGFLQISRDGETRLLLTIHGARDLVGRLLSGITFATKELDGDVHP